MSLGTTQAETWLDSFEFQAESRSYRAEFDDATTSASVAVIGALAKVLNTGPTDIEPLYHTVETDALDAIVHHQSATGDVRISFVLEGREVTVASDGTIEIEATTADVEDSPIDRGSTE